MEQSYEEALKYFRLAADQGHPTAVFCIGECYYKGNGVEKDLAEAAKWYRKALDAGYEPDEEDQEHLIEVLGEGYDKK